MKQKKMFLALLSLMLIISSFMFGASSTEANSASLNPNPSIANPLSQETIDLADEFITLENNRFVITDSEALINKIGEKEFEKVSKEIEDRNATLNGITTKEFEDASVSKNSIEFSKENEYQTFASKGKNGISIYWWGYKVFLNDNLTNTTAQVLLGGSGVAGLVSIWSPWMSAPTAVIKAVAASAVLVLGGSAGMFYKTNKGKGVYLRFTGIVPAHVIYTGMFAQ